MAGGGDCIVVALCGLPASGKTTFASGLLHEAPPACDGPTLVWHICYDALAAAAAASVSVPASATPLGAGARGGRSAAAGDFDADAWRAARSRASEWLASFLRAPDEAEAMLPGGRCVEISSAADYLPGQPPPGLALARHAPGTPPTMPTGSPPPPPPPPPLPPPIPPSPAGPCSGRRLHVVVVDDNCYYRSMRHELFALATAHGARFCQVRTALRRAPQR
jgi:hypothetical protein